MFLYVVSLYVAGYGVSCLYSFVFFYNCTVYLFILIYHNENQDISEFPDTEGASYDVTPCCYNDPVN